MSDKGDGTPPEKEQFFQMDKTEKDAKEGQGEEASNEKGPEDSTVAADEKKEEDVNNE